MVGAVLTSGRQFLPPLFRSHSQWWRWLLLHKWRRCATRSTARCVTAADCSLCHLSHTFPRVSVQAAHVPVPVTQPDGCCSGPNGCMGSVILILCILNLGTLPISIPGIMLASNLMRCCCQEHNTRCLAKITAWLAWICTFIKLLYGILLLVVLGDIYCASIFSMDLDGVQNAQNARMHARTHPPPACNAYAHTSCPPRTRRERKLVHSSLTSWQRTGTTRPPSIRAAFWPAPGTPMPRSLNRVP